MTPLTVIPIILAIAVIPSVLEPDSDPINFINSIIPSVQVACAQGNFFNLCTFFDEFNDVQGNFIFASCEDNGCLAAGGKCELDLNSVILEEINGSPCVCRFPAVGGWFLLVDKPLVLVAGAQSLASWMIPAIVSAIGIGIVIARKF